ncbi:MAG: 3' terminal RNA ribose 2'-O-methyltransferase Hen1 [Myxococcota bacterium]
MAFSRFLRFQGRATLLLTLTTTHSPATDLGYLLGKNPRRVQRFNLASGTAHVYYPHATEERCTAALLLDLDPLALVQQARRQGNLRASYVSTRPYAASSLLSVALSRVFGSALSGRSRERQSLAETPIPLAATVTPVPAGRLLHELFEPLGYQVEATGADGFATLTLRGTVRLADLLAHLYVLIPVLDGDKHYWVGRDEVDKLLSKGGEWLQSHPLHEQIVHRYLKRQRGLAREALQELRPPATERAATEACGRKPKLRQERTAAVVRALREEGTSRVLDVGCGEGSLLTALRRDRSFTTVAGMDVSIRSLERAKVRLERMRPVSLFQGSLTYRDPRLRDYDALCAVEVIEHIDPSRLPAVEDALFAFASPRVVIVTTPNREYNVRYDMSADELRHRDHRFEWTRAEFAAWAKGVAERNGYLIAHRSIGALDPELGAPTQMAIFTKEAS